MNEKWNVTLSSMSGHARKHMTVHRLEASGKGAKGRICNFIYVTHKTAGTLSIWKLPGLEAISTTLDVIFRWRSEVNLMLRVVLLVDRFTIAQELDTTAHQ